MSNEHSRAYLRYRYRLAPVPRVLGARRYGPPARTNGTGTAALRPLQCRYKVRTCTVWAVDHCPSTQLVHRLPRASTCITRLPPPEPVVPPCCFIRSPACRSQPSRTSGSGASALSGAEPQRRRLSPPRVEAVPGVYERGAAECTLSRTVKYMRRTRTVQ